MQLHLVLYLDVFNLTLANYAGLLAELAAITVIRTFFSLALLCFQFDKCRAVVHEDLADDVRTLKANVDVDLVV